MIDSSPPSPDKPVPRQGLFPCRACSRARPVPRQGLFRQGLFRQGLFLQGLFLQSPPTLGALPSQ